MVADRIIKVTCAVAFVLIAVAVIIAWQSPATAYESSIYPNTPTIVWTFLVLSAACGIGIVVHQVYTRQHRRSKLWVLGLLLVIFSYTSLLSLHIIRGYAFWGVHDPATHLGEIKNIIDTGYITERDANRWFNPTINPNYYPVSTILGAQLSQVCGLDPTVFHKFLPIFFALIYVAGMHQLAKAIIPYRGAVILVILAALAPLVGWYVAFVPNGFANLVFPMALFIFIRSLSGGAWQWRILFIIMVLLYPVFHPIPTFMLIAFIVAIPLAKLVLDKMAGRTRAVFDSGAKFVLVALVPILIFGGYWIFTSTVGESFLRHVPANEEIALITATPTAEVPTVDQPAADEPSIDKPSGDHPPADEPTVDKPSVDKPVAEAPIHEFKGGWYANYLRLVGDIQYAQAYGYSVIKVIFILLGGILLYFFMALFALPILWPRIRTNSNLSYLTSLYGIMIAIAVAILVFLFMSVSYSLNRFIAFILITCTVFAGFLAYYLMARARASSRSSMHALIPATLALLLIVTFCIGVAQLYASPLVLKENRQVARTEIEGMDWLFQKKDQTLLIASHWEPTHRFASFLLPVKERSEREDIRLSSRIGGDALHSLPAHFGYHNGVWLGESYPRDIYMVLGYRDRVRYTEIYPELAPYRYYPEDFETLLSDPTLDMLYCNGGFDVWVIRSQSGAGAASS